MIWVRAVGRIAESSGVTGEDTGGGVIGGGGGGGSSLL